MLMCLSDTLSALHRPLIGDRSLWRQAAMAYGGREPPA